MWTVNVLWKHGRHVIRIVLCIVYIHAHAHAYKPFCIQLCLGLTGNIYVLVCIEKHLFPTFASLSKNLYFSLRQKFFSGMWWLFNINSLPPPPCIAVWIWFTCKPHLWTFPWGLLALFFLRRENRWQSYDIVLCAGLCMLYESAYRQSG